MSFAFSKAAPLKNFFPEIFNIPFVATATGVLAANINMGISTELSDRVQRESLRLSRSTLINVTQLHERALLAQACNLASLLGVAALEALDLFKPSFASSFEKTVGVALPVIRALSMGVSILSYQVTEDASRRGILELRRHPFPV